jgi:hypothetical protein
MPAAVPPLSPPPRASLLDEDDVEQQLLDSSEDESDADRPAVAALTRGLTDCNWWRLACALLLAVLAMQVWMSTRARAPSPPGDVQPAAAAPAAAVLLPSLPAADAQLDSCASLFTRGLVQLEWLLPPQLPNLSDLTLLRTPPLHMSAQLRWLGARFCELPADGFFGPKSPSSDSEDLQSPPPTPTDAHRQHSPRPLRRDDATWAEIEKDVEEAEAQLIANKQLHITPCQPEDVTQLWMRRCQILPHFDLPPPPLPVQMPAEPQPPPAAAAAAALAAAPAAAVAAPDVSHLEWLRNSWILLLGDSTDRNMVQWLCHEWHLWLQQQHPAAATVLGSEPPLVSSTSARMAADPTLLQRVGGGTGGHAMHSCTWPALNFTVANIFLNGALETNPTQGQLHELLPDGLAFLHAHFPHPPLAISMQVNLWEAAGWVTRFNVPPAENESWAWVPPFGTVPFLQQLEHEMLRPLAHVFGIEAVVRRVPLTSPRTHVLHSDDPVWRLWTKAPFGTCVWPPPLGDHNCPLSAMEHEEVIRTLRQRDHTLRERLHTVMANSSSWRVRTDGGPILLLRTCYWQKGTAWLHEHRNPSVHSMNHAQSMLARAYDLPFADHGNLPLHFTADGAHLAPMQAQEHFNFILNIIRWTHVQ